MLNKVMFPGIIVSVVLVYVYSVDQILYSLICVPSSLGEKEKKKKLSGKRLKLSYWKCCRMLCGSPWRQRKGRVLQFWAVINMAMGNTLYKKRETQLVICKSGPSRSVGRFFLFLNFIICNCKNYSGQCKRDFSSTLTW